MLRRFLSVIRGMPLINFRFIVNLVRCLPIESGMGPGLVIVRQPCANLLVSLSAVIKSVEVNAFVFQTPPKPWVG